MTAYYNEIDKFAAATLRNLIEAGLIAPGIVDERSIEDVTPNDLHGFTQCHFFAGIGVWSYALRRAGWADSRQVWTGSCPCQPFSAAGKGDGFADERHLWPAFLHLISQCEPAVVIGEQVASKDANPWIDLVHTDLEALGYAFGAVPFPSAGVGAPHIRDRLYWVADSVLAGRPARRAVAGFGSAAGSGGAGGVGNADGQHPGRDADGQHPGRDAGASDSAQRRPSLRTGSDVPATSGDALGLADLHSERFRKTGGGEFSTECAERAKRDGGISQPGPTNGYWRDADWLLCRDGKWRPVEPGTFPLAHGASARVGRLRAYGNAINSQAAQVFIEAVMESL